MNWTALIPMPYRIFLLAGLVGVVWFHGYTHGAVSVQDKWDQARAEQVIKIVKVKEAQDAITKEVEVRYVDRIKVVREKGQTIIEQVPVYLPANSCDLPGNFRLLHDAGVSGTPISGTTSSADAAPIDLETATTTILSNYKTCRETRETLVGLQSWVERQKELGVKFKNEND